MGGWERNQKKGRQERNVVVRIPGRDPTQAVIMADHFDTAYMHDLYYRSEGGTGARVAAAGADDNHSATAALLLAGPLLLALARAGRLGCDVWLIHLTGEEFPSDCLGARHLAQALVERTFRVVDSDGPQHDLSDVRVRGLYVSDMIAHNNERNRYVFQISPGAGPAPARLALTAHRVNLAWNALAQKLNRRAPRRGAPAPSRSDDPDVIPPLTAHAVLRGEVRPDWSPRSTLFNTDGQIFSDVGIPAVLFMEDYDINRRGYHDTHDTMANIDLDYGAAFAAIVIETVAQAAH
jgi:Zn-dependent M28 family amino/carboxypeptidase